MERARGFEPLPIDWKSIVLPLNTILSFYVVPQERIELPTFGLQNHCSTAELLGRNLVGADGNAPRT
jgi:hypothetical protein